MKDIIAAVGFMLTPLIPGLYSPMKIRFIHMGDSHYMVEPNGSLVITIALWLPCWVAATYFTIVGSRQLAARENKTRLPSQG